MSRTPSAAAAALQPQRDYARRHQMRAATLDAEQRSIEAVLATEAPVLVYDWGREMLVEEVLRMDGVALPEQVVLLDAHARWSHDSVIGSTRDLRISGDQLLGRNVFSSLAEDVWTKVREGHITDNSIGYRVLEAVEVPAGQSMEVGGRMYSAGPRRLRIATRWQLRENSIVPIGADYRAKMREEVAMDYETFVRSRGLDPGQLTEAQRAEMQRAFAALQAAPAADGAATGAARGAAEASAAAAAPQDAAALAAEAVRAERERCSAIRRAGEGLDAALVERAINEGWDVGRACSEFLAALRGRSPSAGTPAGPAIHAHSTPDATREMVELHLMQRIGLPPPAGREPQAEQARRLPIYSLLDLCRAALRIDGISEPPGRNEMIRQAMSTISLPKIVENVLNKAILAGYEMLQSTARMWMREDESSDFKPNSRVRLAGAGKLEKVRAGGEIESGTLREWSGSWVLDTYAKIWLLTRQMVINDDLGVFTQIPQQIGAACVRLIDDLAYTNLLANPTLSDSVALFHASHGNLISGQASVLSDSALAAATVKMRQQTDVDGKPLNLEPRYLIVPPELEHTALKLTSSERVLQAGTTAKQGVDYGDVNVWRGRLVPVIEPRLSNAAFSGSSAKKWYLASAPVLAPTVVIGYLSGYRTPTIEPVQPGPDQLGIGYRAVMDLGAGAVDYRGVVRSDGE